MIHTLAKSSYDIARPLFRPLLNHQPMCLSVLEGVYPGTIIVDDPDRPRTALLKTTLGGEDAWCFLVGDADNDVFNRDLTDAIFQRRIIDDTVAVLLFTCHPEDWHGQLAVVLHPQQPEPLSRRHYVCREVKYDWRAHIPNGFSVQRMELSFLEQPGLKVPADVRQTLDKWRAMTDARFGDFGFVVIRYHKVVAWATVDFVAGGAGDIGFFTVEDYRRRGLATIVSAAAIEHGLSHGLSRIVWTCDEENLGSIRTAERLGLERERDYTMHVLSMV
jgi:RimJ/RimL family protein N-acetyltransferase